MNINIIALITGILPIVSVNIAYLLAAISHHVPLCIPYLEGCTSISATGRLVPESLFFRATMIPAAIFMMAYWRLCYEWLMVCGDKRDIGNNTMLWLGMIAAAFLIVYTVALGLIGEQYALQRRIGVTFFFSFTFLAQLLLLNRIKLLSQAGVQTIHLKTYRAKLCVCIIMLLLGLVISPLKALYPENDYLENIIEWNFALLMYIYFIMTYFAWRASNFTAKFSIRES
jgi:hypothetical protein